MNSISRNQYSRLALSVIGALGIGALVSACYVVAAPPHGGGVVVRPVPPPPIIIAGPPRLVFLAQYGIHVAPDLEVSLFFQDNNWYYFHGGGWYLGPSYQGPWRAVEMKRLPPGLTKVPPGQLKKMGKSEGRKFKGK